jgi:hypothetical protein
MGPELSHFFSKQAFHTKKTLKYVRASPRVIHSKSRMKVLIEAKGKTKRKTLI